MAEATPIPATVDAFEQARGDVLDRGWAHGVAWALLMKNVEDDLVDEGLRDALEMVRETGESPEELFGRPAEHAGELYRRWRSQGRLNPSAVPVPNARSVVGSSLRAGGWIALVMSFLALFDQDLPVGVLGLPVVLGFATFGALDLWDWVSRRWTTPVALAAAATAVVGAAAATVAVLDVTSGITLGSLTAWLLLAEWAVLSFAGRATLILVTAKAYASVRDDPGDEQWVHRFAGILRGPGWWSGARVQEIVAEARSHVAESGRTLAEEFGSPDTYAAAYGVNSQRHSGLRLAFLGLLGCLSFAPLLDGFSWATPSLVVILAWTAWRVHRKQRARDQSGR